MALYTLSSAIFAPTSATLYCINVVYGYYNRDVIAVLNSNETKFDNSTDEDSVVDRCTFTQVISDQILVKMNTTTTDGFSTVSRPTKTDTTGAGGTVSKAKIMNGANNGHIEIAKRKVYFTDFMNWLLKMVIEWFLWPFDHVS